MKATHKIIVLIATAWFATSSYAAICTAGPHEYLPVTTYLASNCQYFSGSKELRQTRSGALYNYNNKGNYQDQLYGHSYIYCPILNEHQGVEVSSVEIAVSDFNKQHNVICQLGSSQHTTKGYSAHWGKLTKSENYGEQKITASASGAEDLQNISENFITCSLPPQDQDDQKASSLVAYSTEKIHNH